LFSSAEYGFPALPFSWRLAGKDNLSDELSDGINFVKLEISEGLIVLILMGITGQVCEINVP